MELSIYYKNRKSCLDTWDLYSLLHSNPNDYHRFIKKFICDNCLAFNEIDYFNSEEPIVKRPGNRRKHFWVTLDFTKEILGAYRTPLAYKIKKQILIFEGYPVQNHSMS